MSESSFKIKTNGHARQLLSLNQLTPTEAADFDYVERDGDEEHFVRFFRYRGATYDTHEFENLRYLGGAETTGWHLVQTESAYSAVLIRYPEDERGHRDIENVVVGYAYW